MDLQKSPKGWLNINKEPDITSHDLVSKVRKKLKTKKVGHAGTLDPMATGVMVIAVGQATRLIQFLKETKAYKAEIKLGLVTDSLDITGKVLEEKEVIISENQLIEVVNKFKGKINQVPPMVSAVHHNGVRLYELARQGIEVERKSREVEIYSIKILNINFPYFEIEIHCQSGTYIRTIADDIGKILGCGACLTTLKRIQSNALFNGSDSKNIQDINEEDLLDIEYPLSYMNEIKLNDEQSQKYLHGQHLSGFSFDNFVRVKNNENKFIGIAYSLDNKLIPKVSFVE